MKNKKAVCAIGGDLAGDVSSADEKKVYDLYFLLFRYSQGTQKKEEDTEKEGVK